MNLLSVDRSVRCLRALCVALAAAPLLAGCWGWIPEDPTPPGAEGTERLPPPSNPAPGGVASRVARAPGSYQVVSGDTLFSIAWRFRLTVSDLAAWNNLGDGTLIFPGQRLSLTPPPGHAGRASSSAAAGSGPAAKPAAGQGSASSSAGETPVSGRPSKAVAQGGRSGTRTAASSPSSPGAKPSATRAVEPAAAPRPAKGGGKWRWPAQGRVDAKGARVRADDYGVRIMGQRGQNVYATDGGKVMYAGDGLKAYGLLVIVQHSPEWLSAYGHNEKILVKEGERVESGQPIATMGIGPANTAMLHFEIRRNGKPVEPLSLLPPRN